MWKLVINIRNESHHVNKLKQQKTNKDYKNNKRLLNTTLQQIAFYLLLFLTSVMTKSKT